MKARQWTWDLAITQRSYQSACRQREKIAEMARSLSGAVESIVDTTLRASVTSVTEDPVA